MAYEVRHHKGRSGKSAYAWRVYSVWAMPYSQRKRQTQLGKYRSREAAERALEFYQARDAEVKARNEAHLARML